MLASLSANQFNEWLAFDLLEREITHELQVTQALTNEAIAGVEEIRSKVRGGGEE